MFYSRRRGARMGLVRSVKQIKHCIGLNLILCLSPAFCQNDFSAVIYRVCGLSYKQRKHDLGINQFLCVQPAILPEWILFSSRFISTKFMGCQNTENMILAYVPVRNFARMTFPLQCSVYFYKGCWLSQKHRKHDFGLNQFLCVQGRHYARMTAILSPFLQRFWVVI